MAKETNVPAVQDPKMVAYQAKDGQDIQLTLEVVKNFLVTGNKDLVTAQEFIFFMAICKARGLNPFAKDCYLIKYSAGDTAAIITAIDFYRARARAQKDCVGWEKGIICLNKDTGEIRYSKGLLLPNETLVGGWFRAKPVGWEVEFMLEVNLAGYIKTTSTGAITKFWREENQPTMIAKVAESQGLRALWPDEFRGTLTGEEAGIALDSMETLDITSLQIAGALPSSPDAAPDTSEFAKLVATKDLTASEMALLENFLTETAASQKKGKVTTAQVKVRAVKNFDGFWQAFENWKAGKQPPPAVKTLTPEAIAAGQAEYAKDHPPAGPGAETPAQDQGSGEGDGPDPGSQGDDPSFEKRRGHIWGQIVSKGVPLADLGAKVGILSLPEINPGNIDSVAAYVNAYEPKRSKK